jgi:hypothetical protein
MRTITITLLSAILLLLSGCGPKLQPFRGSYSDKPFQIETIKSKEEVWNKIIELFATRGLTIKLIDKSSGLIVSEKTSFLNSYTVENENGTLVDPNAFIVCDRMVWQTVEQAPLKVSGEWNIRLVETTGKTLINVNLVNIEIIYYSLAEPLYAKGKSTGKFEKIISDFIK